MLSLLRSGVQGFLSDEEVDTDLRLAIQSVVEGRVWIRLKYLMPGNCSNHPFDGTTFRLTDHFTPQQRRVVDLVNEGLSNKEVAAELGISERTVKFHLQNVFLSLGVNSRHAIQDSFARPALSARTV
jgi:DNA-binding NarL/FixJ family response regulator